MAVLTRRELQDRIKELESENEDLRSRLDEISDIIGDDDNDESPDDDIDTDQADTEEEDDDQGEE